MVGYDVETASAGPYRKVRANSERRWNALRTDALPLQQQSLPRAAAPAATRARRAPTASGTFHTR
jgi:hypothetical protein